MLEVEVVESIKTLQDQEVVMEEREAVVLVGLLLGEQDRPA